VNPEKDLMSTPINEFVDEFMKKEYSEDPHFEEIGEYYQQLFDELIPKYFGLKKTSTVYNTYRGVVGCLKEIEERERLEKLHGLPPGTLFPFQTSEEDIRLAKIHIKDQEVKP